MLDISSLAHLFNINGSMESYSVHRAHSFHNVSKEHFDEFSSLSNHFNKFHQNECNILLHFLSTPLGVMGFFSLFLNLTKSTSATIVLCLVYYLSLLTSVPIGVFIGTTITCALCVQLARTIRLGFVSSLGVIFIAYVAQDLSHLLTGEPTFQGSYSNGGHINLSDFSGWSQLFTQHCYFLVPLVVNLMIPRVNYLQLSNVLTNPLPSSITPLELFAWFIVPFLIWTIGNYCLDSRNGYTFFPGCPYFSRVVHCNIATDPDLDSDSRKNELSAIRQWTLSKMPPKASSSHWWFRELEPDTKRAFERCATAPQILKAFRSLFSEKHYCLDVVDGMNEIYVTGPPRFEQEFNSDQIFYTKHVDGPYGLIPFVSVFRCIVGMDRNEMITTHFPMADKAFTCKEGDAVAFDFNREVHYIVGDESKRSISDEYRVVLKLHYCVYPRILAPLGWVMHWLNVRYNEAFRALFLKTIQPETAWERFLAWNVVMNTTLFNSIETYIGQRNLIYIIFAATLWYVTGCYDWFLLSTSYTHYIRYIGTYFWRNDIDYGSFKRDVLVFKVLALAQIFIHYAVSLLSQEDIRGKIDFVSIFMIIIGYGISVQATNVLGLDRTYFGAELGKCPAKWINQFPYGYIPHPMIVSQIFALLGVMKANHFRHDYPYLIHWHVLLYIVHMLQEHFDLHYDSVKHHLTNEHAKKKQL